MIGIPRNLRPDSMVVRDPVDGAYGGEYGEPYTVEGVRFECAESLAISGYTLTDGSKGMIYTGSTAPQLPVGALIEVQGRGPTPTPPTPPQGTVYLDGTQWLNTNVTPTNNPVSWEMTYTCNADETICAPWFGLLFGALLTKSATYPIGRVFVYGQMPIGGIQTQGTAGTHTLRLVNDGTSNILYLDNVAVGISQFTSWNITPTSIILGAQNASGTYPFIGQIARLHIWDNTGDLLDLYPVPEGSTYYSDVAAPADGFWDAAGQRYLSIGRFEGDAGSSGTDPEPLAKYQVVKVARYEGINGRLHHYEIEVA
jgi:hypothetical protein